MIAPAPRFALDSIIVGPSPRMRTVLDYIARIGPGAGTVLVTGESGTGKELVANAIHAHSRRSRQPFVPISCALFSDSLIESELFGHERGAFTGAVSARPGRFERAQGGTIFLDDIDDIPLAMQVKLLRALQNRTIERLGATDPTPIDVRVIAGTKRDLRRMVREGTFREDLYYRLNVLSLDLPPLRERREDIPVLARHFFQRFFSGIGKPAPPISDGVMQAFLAYEWPGNVRELENACERAAESCNCGRVGVGCVAASVLFHSSSDVLKPLSPVAPAVAGAVPSALSEPSALVATASIPSIPSNPSTGWTSAVPSSAHDDVPLSVVQPGSAPFVLDEHLARVEADLIAWALARSGGNKSRAASLLGIKRSTLGDRIARSSIPA